MLFSLKGFFFIKLEGYILCKKNWGGGMAAEEQNEDLEEKMKNR